MKSNLIVTETGRVSFAFHSVCSIYLPDNTPDKDSIWKDEERFLRIFREWHGLSALLKRRIDLRLEQLEKALGTDVGGLMDDLFWPSPKGSCLKLSGNFSLCRIPQGDSLTQAEVFFCFSSLLHNLRVVGVGDERLVNGIHQRTLIDPKTFRRFGDGIAQASILRGAIRGELNYEIKNESANEAAEIICSVFEQRHNKLGEGSCEFLMALALGQMRLSLVSFHRVIERAMSLFPRSSIEFHLAKYLSEPRS